MFFLELNHDTLTIWYQIDQCHFAYTAESLVPYLKLYGLLTRAFSQPATDFRLMEGKLSIGLLSFSFISFNDNAIVRNFTLQSFSKICRQFEGNLHMITFDYRTMLHLCFWWTHHFRNFGQVWQNRHLLQVEKSFKVVLHFWDSPCSLAVTARYPLRFQRSWSRLVASLVWLLRSHS